MTYPTMSDYYQAVNFLPTYGADEIRKTVIPELDENCFDWITWRNGVDVWINLGIKGREADIVDHAELIRKFAVGYIPGSKIFYRYKPTHTAVMFMFPDFFGWTHLTNKEFEEVFCVR